MNPVERRIRSVSDRDVYESVREAFPEKPDREIITDLTRMIVLVAVSWNDIVEGDENPSKVLSRQVFGECDEFAHYFPWPSD